jgi:hypothetical protein
LIAFSWLVTINNATLASNHNSVDAERSKKSASAGSARNAGCIARSDVTLGLPRAAIIHSMNVSYVHK